MYKATSEVIPNVKPSSRDHRRRLRSRTMRERREFTVYGAAYACRPSRLPIASSKAWSVSNGQLRRE